MLIEELIRSCVHESVAQAAVVCIGRKFSAEVKKAADGYDMTIGAFVALSVDRFARHGDEAELRAVRAAMDRSQEPILAGLHRILCIMLAAGVPAEKTHRRQRVPRLHACDIDHLEAVGGRLDYLA